MVPSFRIVFTAALLLSGASTLVLAVFSYRQREKPGALPFAGLAASLALWAFVYAVGIQIRNPTARIAILQIQWLAHPSVPLFLFLFGLSYTGHDEVITRRTLPLIAAIPILVVVGAWTNPWHHLLWTDQVIHVVDGMSVLVPTYGPLFWINIVYGYGIEAVAIAMLIRLVYESDYLYADQSALLLLGIAIPFVANVHEIFIVGATPAVDWTPIAFAASGVAFGAAVFRHQLFDLIPATRTLGRDDAITQLESGIVIIDSDDRVVYANGEAGDIFERDPRDMLGRQVQSFVDEEWVDFDAVDALAEAERGGRTYEIRTSPITDRSGREIGHTLVLYDVTARKRRERELATVNELNALIRGVNQALVSATSREDIECAVAAHLADADLYEGVRVADVQTWMGEADRWRVSGTGVDDDSAATVSGGHGAIPPELDIDRIRAERDGTADGDAPVTAAIPGDATASNWLIVPMVYGRTVYGAIGLVTDRTDVSDREREVLGELGELVGHAINTTESRRLFATDGVIEMTVAVEDDADPVVAVTVGCDARIDVVGIVPKNGEGNHAFLEVTGGDIEAIRDRLAAADVDVRIVEGDGESGFIDVALDQATSLAPIAERDTQLLRGTVANGTATYELLVPTAAEGRTLIDRLSAVFDGTDLRAKRERDHPFDTMDGMTPEDLESLTDRQREALEVAYRAGYFEWPRDANAEEVAESMDITSPTLHSHLRKAQRTLFEDLFDRDPE